MSKLKILIVDDEKRVRTTLKNIINTYYKDSEIIGEAQDVDDAYKLIDELKPEVVLLDIKMPKKSGFELLRAYNPLPFKVIFITAFNQFAIQAFKFSAIDYLLKPVIPEELVKALDRAKDQIINEELTNRVETLMINYNSKTVKKSKIVLNSLDKIHIIAIEDIIRCEADGNYTKFYLNDNKSILVSKQLKEYDEMLEGSGFFRPHHSHLINLDYIVRLDKKDGGFLIMKDNSEVPVSSRKYKEVIQKINNL